MKHKILNDTFVLGDATALTKGFNFDREVDQQTFDKKYDVVDPVCPNPPWCS